MGVHTAPKKATTLHYSQRYPQTLWDHRTPFTVPTWSDYDVRARACTYQTVSFTLPSLADHVVRGQNLFPAAGFLRALWAATSYVEGTQIDQFRIVSPCVLPDPCPTVTFQLRRTGTYSELWDMGGEVCYATGHVHVPPARLSPPIVTPNPPPTVAIPMARYYPHIRRLGYEYGQAYQLLDQVEKNHAVFQRPAGDWIAYIDAGLHLLLREATSFAYPVGMRRVVFNRRSLAEMPQSLHRRGTDTVFNAGMVLEGIRMEHVPLAPTRFTVHGETFVPYADTSTPSIHPTIIATMLQRESSEFCVVGPIASDALREVIAIFRATTRMCEVHLVDAPALVITEQEPTPAIHPSCVLTAALTAVAGAVSVGRWGDLRLWRLPDQSPPDIVADWHGITRGDCILHTPGASGAVASLRAEGYSGLRSYEGPGLIGLEKGMCLNFVREDLSHGVYVDVVLPQTRTTVPLGTADGARLCVARPGHLGSLYWTGFTAPASWVVVTAAALNFRDVMRAMGQLREADLSIGLEFSGINRAGQRVFGVAKNALSTHVVPTYSFPTPPTISDADAATIPVVYLTVYYALFEKARMRPGDTVLIHAGVGIAAITVAQARGYTVLTTCSAPKRSFLKERFGLTDAQIGDSRSASFVETVLAYTKGRGVDVVLNQLSGELQDASLRCLAPGGHFCEIGKYDIVQDRPLGQSLLEANISFHVIDLLPLLGNPAYKAIWDTYLRDGFEKEEMVPLPVTAFATAAVEDAFRYMSQSKHIGKILINGFTTITVAPFAQNLHSETHLITGGLGGLGLSLASRLVRDGCRHLILVSRGGTTDAFQYQQIQLLEAVGCRVLVFDRWSGPPSHRIASGMRQQSTAMPNGDYDKWNSVVDTKLAGYHRLRHCFPTTPIVAISSVVAYFGNAGQSHYALANAALDAAARADPQTLSIRLGALDNVGFITTKSTNRTLFETVPFALMRIDDVLDRLQEVSALYDSGVFAVYDWKTSTRPSSTTYTLLDAQSQLVTILGGTPDRYPATTILRRAGLDSLC